jgi:agmatinase
VSLPPPRLIGLPYDASSSHLRGPALAPPVIRQALHSAAGNLWTEALQNLARGDTLLGDAGDLVLPDSELARVQIEQGVGALLSEGFRPIALGGDHSVTYPVLRAMNAVYPRPAILHIDAHPDLYEEFDGDRYSHACPFARILEENLASRLVQVGIRAMNGHQRDQAARYNVHVIDMRAWTRGVRPTLDGQVYLSIDIDALDPAFAPGVSHREPGGLSVRDVIGIVHDCGGTIVGADIVEFNPLQDATDMTARVAAKIVKEVAGRMFSG